MLNKPTKVYPYNDFIDVADGLDFKFSLNNTFTGGYISVYDSLNDQLVERIHMFDFNTRPYSQKGYNIHSDIVSHNEETISGNDMWRIYNNEGGYVDFSPKQIEFTSATSINLIFNSGSNNLFNDTMINANVAFFLSGKYKYAVIDGQTETKYKIKNTTVNLSSAVLTITLEDSLSNYSIAELVGFQTDMKDSYQYGKDYYWNFHYWLSPSSTNYPTTSKATKLFTKNILDWNKSDNRISIANEPKYTISNADLRESYMGNYYKVTIDLNENNATMNTIKQDLENGIEYWVVIPKSMSPLKITKIQYRNWGMSGGSTQGFQNWETTPPLEAHSYFKDDNSKPLYFYKGDVNGGLCNRGDCCTFEVHDLDSALSGKIYCSMLKIQSAEINARDGENVVDIFFEETLPLDFGTVKTPDGIYGTVTCYENLEYKVSSPYYFSVREKKVINWNAFDNDKPLISISPFINSLSNNNVPCPFETSFYYYEIYKQNNNKMDILKTSPKYSTWKLEGNSQNKNYYLETFVFKGLKWDSIYKVKLIGQTWEGMDFEVETTFQTSNFEPTQVTEFIEFDKDKGCIKINSSKFTVPDSSYELQLYRYNHETEMLDYVSTVKYDVNTSNVTGGILKYSYVYDFNIISGVEYTYYAFIINSTSSITSSFKSNSVIPRWYGTYLTDLTYVDKDVYTPDLDNIWFVDLNYEPGEVSRNYQVNHPIGINQQYPKSIRGKANYKTGSLSGLLGKISCTNGKYEETLLLNDKWDEFCGNGNLKLIRGHTRSENMIADIDSMNTSVYNYKATLLNIGYTQIDDLTLKQINKEV